MDEAFPYIAKRLITDDSPRLQAALRYMVGGRRCLRCGERARALHAWRLPPRLLAAPLTDAHPPHNCPCPRNCPQVYGRDTVFDADRLIDLLDAFETFTEASR